MSAETNHEQIARAAVGALLALRDLAEIGFSGEALADFADLTVRAALPLLGLEMSESQADRLKDENVVLVANSGLLEE